MLEDLVFALNNENPKQGEPTPQDAIDALDSTVNSLKEAGIESREDLSDILHQFEGFNSK